MLRCLGSDHTLTLRTVNNLGLLYEDQGKLAEAEEMYQRALQGYEKALGPDHTSTLSIINNLTPIYADQGKLVEAEEMLQRALQECEKAIGPENISTYIPALNTIRDYASLFYYQGRNQDARIWYSKALSGYQKVLGNDHSKCEALRKSLTTLDRERDRGNAPSESVLVREHTYAQPIIESYPPQNRLVSRRHRLLKKLGWKQA